MRKNILVSTFGISEALIFELLGFTNPDNSQLYQNYSGIAQLESMRKKHAISSVSEVWLVSTSASPVIAAYENCKKSPFGKNIRFRFFTLNDLKDLQTQEDREYMRELIYRTVLKASKEVGCGGKLFLSMVGGFKTMSADIQEAGTIFGFHVLLHCVASGREPISIPHDRACSPLNAEIIDRVVPVVVDSARPGAIYLYNSEIRTEAFPIEDITEQAACKASLKGTFLVEAINKKRKEADIILSNYSLNNTMELGNFRAFSCLHPRIQKVLRTEQIGLNPRKDLEWLRKLPKAELHCHFGGILSPKNMIEVALSETERVNQYRDKDKNYASWLNEVRHYVQEEAIETLYAITEDKNRLRNHIPGIPEPLSVCGFLIQFEGKPDLLEKVIYRKSGTFSGIGIEAYEKLGDLQGSALMQSRACIQKACDILIEYCKTNSILYLELRCSPVNYTRGELSAKEVVSILLEKFSKLQSPYITLLFIASRHGRMSNVFLHIELFEELFSTNDRFKERFVGFDLAGSEKVRTPKELSAAFESIHNYCQNITIHAGETDTVERIWEAVYCLNADRIGHGLKLKEKEELLSRFIERRIGIEMCPSSNFQICNYKKFQPQESWGEIYPLKHYIKNGVRVTINTDNPGISKTDLSNEYLMAAQMTPGGLSRWEILQLVKNAFSAGFTPLKKRREILKKAEDKIIELIKSEYGN